MPGYVGGGADSGDAKTNAETEADMAERQATAEGPAMETGEGEAPGE